MCAQRVQLVDCHRRPVGADEPSIFVLVHPSEAARLVTTAHSSRWTTEANVRCRGIVSSILVEGLELQKSQSNQAVNAPVAGLIDSFLRRADCKAWLSREDERHHVALTLGMERRYALFSVFDTVSTDRPSQS